MNSVLECKGIIKTYGKLEVLHSVDLTIEKGKIYGLIGRNGVGKTTLLSILAAHNPATSGTVTYDGEKVWENAAALSHICFSRELNSSTALGRNPFKIKDYMRMASTYYPNWDNEYAQALIKDFNLDIKKKIAKLSKGMMSMVTIVIALASGADITMLDEPVAGLDVVMRVKFYDLLLAEYEKTGRTFVISTHIIEEAANIFEEVIIINNGDVLLKENTTELVESFRHLSGKADVIEKITSGMETYQRENLGRAQSVVVRIKDEASFAERISGEDVDVSPINLQKAFVALCGEVVSE